MRCRLTALIVCGQFRSHLDLGERQDCIDCVYSNRSPRTVYEKGVYEQCGEVYRMYDYEGKEQMHLTFDISLKQIKQCFYSTLHKLYLGT